MTTLTSDRAEELLASHVVPAYAMACALLGDEVAAGRVVALGVADLARSTEPWSESTRVALATFVYRQSQQIDADATTAPQLPATMLWLRQLARLQRASLALCVFGGLTHREAARLLGVAPLTVARSLTSGLKDLGHLAVADRNSIA
jgi:Sigma-70, region 4